MQTEAFQSAFSTALTGGLVFLLFYLIIMALTAGASLAVTFLALRWFLMHVLEKHRQEFWKELREFIHANQIIVENRASPKLPDTQDDSRYMPRLRNLGT
jgi:hypothetical protein